MNKDDLSALYGALVGKGYTTQDLGDENTFRSKMADKNSRKELYDYVSERGDFKIGSYDNYEGRIAPLFTEKQSVNTQQSSSVGAGSVAQQVSNEFDKANLPQSEFSPYVRGKGADVEIFGVPLSDYNKMPPEKQSRVYSEAIELKKQEDKNVFSNYISAQLGEINSVLDQKREAIVPAAGSAFIPSTAVAAAQRFGNGDNKEKQDRYTSLHAAKNLLDDANKLAKEAKKGDKGFFSSLGRGFKDKFVDADNWTMGLTDAAYSRLLRKAVEKEERGEGLSSEETRLLDAAAVNMATQAYFSSDMSRGYKAGTMTAESIPFMLEFAVNPISSTGNALAKGLLKHGLKKFGRVAASNMAKVAGRLTGDAVAAAGMTATTGLGHVVAGANERMIGDIQSTVEDGEIKYDGRENGMDTGEAIVKSAASNFLENQSEMVFNAFAGGGKMAKEVLDKFVPGFSKLSNSEIAQVISKIRNNPMVKNVAKRTQFHGILGEYAEEVYNNLANIPLGEMSLEQVTDLDQNIDTFLGLAPTSVAFGLLGLGGMARESYSSKRNLRRFKDGLSESDKILFDELEQVINTGDKETTKAFIKRTLNDDNLTPEKKKENVFAVQDMAKVKAVEDMQKDPEVSVPQEVEANKVDIYRNYKRAERKLNSLIPTEIIPQLDNVTDIEQFAHDNNLNDNQAMVISDYLTAKQPFSQYVEQTNQRRAEIKVAAREQAMADVEKISNPDTGLVSQVKHKFTEEPVYLVGGQLSFGEDGVLDRDNSTPTVYYVDEKGERKMANPEDFDGVLNETAAPDMITQAEIDADNDFVTAEEEYLRTPEIPIPTIGEVFTMNGSKYLIEGDNVDAPSESVMAIKLNDEGEIDVDNGDERPVSLDEYYSLRETELWGEDVPVSDVGTQDPTETIYENPIILSENQLENELSSRVEDNETIDNQPSSEEIPSIPSDEKGNLLYHKAPVDVTIDSFHREELEPEEIDSFVQVNKDASNKLLSTLEEKKPKIGTNIAKYKADKLVWQEKISDAKSQVEYWNSVDEEIVASRVRPGDKAAEAILSMGEPMTGEELAATMLGTGRLPVLFDSYKKETGGRNAEARGMVGLFASKANGGMTIEEAGEQLMLADQENGTNFFDPNDPNAGRNAIIDVLSGARTRGDLFNYIKSNREVMAERERQAEYDAYSSWTESNFGMKPEDYEAYEEQASPSIAERFKDFDEEEFYNNIINELDGKQGEITGATASSEVLQGEGIVSPERTGASENEGGAVRVSAESGSEEGIVSEEAPVVNQGLGENENKILNADSNFISLPNDNQIDNENDEVSESIPQGEYGALSEEDGRIEEALSECRRRSSQNERYAQADSGTLSGREQKEIENRAAEDYAKEKGKWIPMQDVFSLGVPAPSGNENDVYLDTKDNSVYKVNNLMNSGNVTSLLERIKLHNEYFPQTKYELVGFSGFEGGDVFPVLKQGYVENAMEASPDEINSYMRLLGFNPTGEASYSNDDITISDLRPRNVLKDVDGDIYVIDADFKKETPIPVGKTIDTGEYHNDPQRDTSLLQDVSASSDNKQEKRKFVAPELSQGEDVLSYAGIIAETKIDVTDSGINSENGTVLEEAPVANQNLEVEFSDENGNPFAKTKDDNVDFGYITSETGLSEAPIRLVDGTTSYGKQHIEQNHGSQIRRAGFETVEDFVSHVSSHYNVVRLGNKYFDKNTYILEVADKKNNTLFIELSSDGTYWNVNSAGVFRKDYSKNKEVIWTAPALGHNSTTENKEVASSITGNEGSTGSTSGDSSQITSSENKDSEVSDNKQEKRKFVAPELSQGEDVLSYAGRISEAKQLFDAEQEVNLSPTEAQKEAGNYKKGHVKIDGYDITIENPKGSERRGVDANGQPWSVSMNNSYGYIRGTEGIDGDHIDIFLSDNPSSGNVFVVDQMNEDDSFDEHKVMYGFSSIDEAKDAYLANYSPGWKGLGTITEVSKEEFKKWVDSSKRKTKVFAEYKSVAEKVSDNENPLRFDLSGDNVSVTESKSLSDYKRVMNLANTFEEKYLGAGRSFVIKSNDTLRKQLEAIGTPESAITDIENKVLSGKGLACYEPNTDRTIIFNTSASDDVINGYLWHENTHRALDSVFGAEKEERINSVYEYIEPTHKPQFEVIRNSYSDRSEIEKKEECITYYFEDFFVRKGEKELEKIIDEASPIMKDFFKPIFNKIVYGREEGSHVDGSGRIDEISGKESPGMVLNSLLTESGEEKEGRRGKEESSRSSDSGGTRKRGVRFREGEPDDVSDGTREAYEKAINTKGSVGKAHLSAYNFQEAFQDEMLSVKLLQEIIEKHSGEKLKGFENAYLAENRLGSTNREQRNKFIEEFYEPLMKIVDDLMKKGISEKEIKKYLIAKSGLERNREFAVRDGIAAIENDSDKKSAQKLRKQYEDSRNILRKQYAEGKLGWDEYQDKLDELAALYTNKFVDYSGLTAITNDKTHFTDIAKDIVREFEAKQNTDALWSSINAATKFALKKSYDSGITSKETYNHVSDMFEYYIPMRGWSKETAEDVYDYINQDRGTFSATIKKAEGHLHESQDPFAIIGNMAESAILQGNRNLMKQKFMNMVINHPSDVAKLSRVWFKESGDKWEASFPDIANDATADEVAQAIEVHEKEMLDLQKEGKAECRSSKLDINYHITPKNISQHAVVVKRGGKDYVVYINGTPRAAEALNGKLKMGEQDVLWSFYDYIKRMYAAGMTSYNVNFVGANVSRDIQHAFFITYIDKGIGAAAKLAKNGPKALKTVHRGVSGNLDLHKKEDVYYKEFLENGGETGYSNLNSIEEWKADNDKRLARLKGSAKGTGYAKAGLSHLNDWFEFANRIAENSTRFNAYMLARESGKGVGEAINDAKNITVNFNKKGSSQTPGFFGAAANIFRRWMLFANPIIQGMYQVYHVSKQHKARAASAFAFHTALGVAVPVLNTFLVGMYGDDDDDYFNQNDFTRRNNLMLYIPRVGYLKIPLAPIFRNMYAMGDILYMKMNGLSTTEDMFFDSVKEARALFSLEGQSGQKEWSPARFLLPDLVGPILDVAENENFAGSPIYKDTEFNKLDPEFKKIYKDAWAPLVELSRVMNTVAGGNDYRKSDIGKWANPAAMQHLITNYTGGVGQLIGDVSSAFSDAITGDFVENFDMMKVPVAKRFFTIPNERTSGTAIRREYFKIKDEMDVLNHEIKERAKNAGGDLKLLNKLSELQNSEEYDMLLNFKKESKGITKEESPEKKVERMKKVVEWYNEKKKK